MCFLFCCKCNKTVVMPYPIYNTWAGFMCKIHTSASVEFSMDLHTSESNLDPLCFPELILDC